MDQLSFFGNPDPAVPLNADADPAVPLNADPDPAALKMLIGIQPNKICNNYFMKS